jgi:large subunit ribosomal protein L24
MPARIKAGDDVVVVGGKDRGKRGKVLRVEPRKNRLYVEGLNMVKRHQKPRQVAGAQRAEQVGGVIEKEGPIHLSNVMLADPTDGRPTRIGIEVEDGRRFRIARRSGTRID